MAHREACPHPHTNAQQSETIGCSPRPKMSPPIADFWVQDALAADLGGHAPLGANPSRA